MRFQVYSTHSPCERSQRRHFGGVVMARAKTPAVIDAYTAFCREASRRKLDVPDQLRDELRYTLRVPIKAEPELYARLLDGCQVLDSHGGKSAPDSLWLLWECLLIAWQCADAAMVALQHRALRQPRKEFARVSPPLPTLSFERS